MTGRHVAPTNRGRRRAVTAIAGLATASLIGGAGYAGAAILAAPAVNANCTGAPLVVTDETGGQSITITCTVPKPAVAPEPTPTPTPEPTQAPEPVTAPAAGQGVTIGGQSLKVDKVNAARGANELVTYKAPVTVTTTNQYGVEVVVTAGKVASVNDRVKASDATGTTVPAAGYVLSGHDTAGDWLRTNAKVGSSITIGAAPVTPTPTTPAPTENPGPVSAAPQGLPAKVQALYHMMWPNSGSPALRTTPAQVNVVNLAFMQGNPPSIVGWSNQGEAQFIAEARALRAKGVRIVASIGGAHGQVNVSNRQAFVDGVMALNAKLPLDGLDWDLEGQAMGQADVVWISKELKRLRGDKFAITMAPNGSNINEYQVIANELHRQNALDFIGQQFYDAPVTKEAALGRIRQLVSGGLPQEKVGVGMMIGAGENYWTVDKAVEVVRFIKASYPNIRGGYLWEAGRAGTADWATRLAPILK